MREAGGVNAQSGSIGETVEDGVSGYLVAQGDEEALGKRVARLLANGGLARAMGQAGRAAMWWRIGRWITW